MTYKVPTASTTDRRAMKVGSGLNVASGVVSTQVVALFDQAYFYDTTIQTNPVGGAINTITYNSAAVNVGITLVGGSAIQVSKTANYNVQISLQIDKSDSGSDIADFWILRNGIVPCPATNSEITLVGPTSVLLGVWGYLLALNANDTIQVVWQALDTSIRLLLQPAKVGPVRPATPCVRVTIVQL